jgi:hypothetical protein
MCNSDQIKGAAAIDDDTDRENAVHALAEAFATIEENREYLPDDFYANFAHRLQDWIADAQWSVVPKLMRQILPIILREVIFDEEEED